MTPRPINRIAVLGDGVAAWVAAAGFARLLRGTEVVVVPVGSARAALSDRFGGTLPSADRFHRRIGLRLDDLVAATGAVFRLGWRLQGWAGGDASTITAFGDYGCAIAGAAFHQLWCRADGDGDVAPFGAYSPAAALADAGRFVPPEGDPSSPMSHFEFALAVDPASYRAYLRAYARHLGAREATAPFATAAVADARIASLRLVSGEVVEADLFVDASGPDAMLLSHLPGGSDRDDWGRWLPCDCVAVGEVPADPTLPPVDTAAAEAHGWRLAQPLRARTLTARLYRSTGVRDQAGTVIALAAGRRRRAWIGNCVAIGDAAVEVEPLAAPHLHLIHAAVERIVALLPDTAFAPVEIEHYNREWRQEADRLRDFLLLHYALSTRTEPFWKQARSAPLPTELADTLALFGERGRLPHRDRESYGRGEWLATLIGLGARPATLDAIAAAVPPMQFATTAEHHRAAIARAVAAAPSHAQVIARLSRRSVP